MSSEPKFPYRAEFNDIKELVASEFTVEDSRIELETLTFQVKINGNSKLSFERLAEKLKHYGLIPLMRRRDKAVFIYITPKPTARPTRLRTNVILLFATLGTVFITGYLNSLSWAKLFGENQLVQAGYFTAALMAIVGLHEIGHKITAQRRKIESTPPYFIPGPPFPIGFGTFGAVILQKEPPANRDCLFDLGFSGPVTGFIITLIVTVAAILGTRAVDPAALERIGVQVMEIPVSPAWTLLHQILKPEEVGLTVIPPVGWAAWLGFVITYLNLLPIWQLDGGHIARALFGEKGYRFAAVGGIAVTFATGFWFFGLLILLLSSQARGSVILDDVSPLSKSRVVLGVLAYVILVLCVTVIWSM